MEKCRNCGAEAVDSGGRCGVCRAQVPSTTPASPPTVSSDPPTITERFAAPDVPVLEVPRQLFANPWLLIVGVLALVVLAGGGILAGIALGDQSNDTAGRQTPGAPTAGAPDSGGTDAEPTDAGGSSPAELDDPLDVGIGQRNLACGSGYIVVLTSSELATPAQTVSTALRRFSDAPGRSYLDPASSCDNLSHLTNKVNQRMFPFMGPYPDPVAACDARMQHADTTTYVIGVDAGHTTATYCACPYADADLPFLNEIDDSAPTGDNVFWTLELQYMLHEAGYNPGRLVDGQFGPRTAEMVRGFQRSVGTSATGSMDSGSWTELKSSVC